MSVRKSRTDWKEDDMSDWIINLAVICIKIRRNIKDSYYILLLKIISIRDNIHTKRGLRTELVILHHRDQKL